MMKSPEDVKEDLIRYLQRAVRDLQKEYVRNRDVISSSELTNSLCYALEAVFLHGLVSATAPDKASSYNFWAILSAHTHKCTLGDVDALSQIKTDIGRCRVWIRMALNGGELESYIRLIFADSDGLRQYYEPWSFFQDVERMDLLLTSIQGLECVRFHLGHNSTVLNSWSNVSLALAGQTTSNLPPNLSPLDLSGVDSFDDYELSPDDREEVRLMFRIEGEPKVGTERRVKHGRSNRVQSDVSLPSQTVGVDLDDPFEGYGALPAKRAISLDVQHPSSVECVLGDSRSVSEDGFRSESTNGRMTDEMRDLRFNRIVMENLEKYPLDYDRLQLQREVETPRVMGRMRPEGCNGGPSRDGVGFVRSRGPELPSCSETDGSSMEPDAFWSTLHDDQWNDTDARLSGGSLSDSGTPVQGNSLPRDTWISPPVDPGMSTGSTAFSAKSNDHLTSELEASYGKILADYKLSMPRQLKMVSAENVRGFFSDCIDGRNCTNGVGSTKKHQNLTGVEIEGDWVVVEEDCPFTAEPYHIDSSSNHLLPFVTRRFAEKTIDEQGYRCRGCSKEIAPGRSRRCGFDGHCYCSHCLQSEAFYIPSQILYSWHFKKRHVSTENHKFLKKVYDWPLLNIEELNPKLYEISDELNLVRDLRRQSYYLAGYMFHCSSPYSVKYWRAMNARLYYFSHIDNYSVKDLVNVHSGSFRKALQKINDSAMKHVYECKGCSIRGYYCEICQDPKVIYPFDVNNTVVCDRCRNTYHKHCKLSQELACPKCNRIQLRQAASPVDPMDLVMFTHPADVADL